MRQLGFTLKIFLLAFLFVSPSYAIDDAIIAIVNDEIITLKDLKDYIHSTYVSLVAEGIEEEQLKAIVAELQTNGINKLIEDKLILSKANELGIEVRDKIVEDRLTQIKKKYPTEEVFIQALVENGATITDLKNKIVEQYKIKFVIEHEVKSKIFVNPQEVTEYYDTHIENYQKKERINVDSIYIPFGDDKEQARQKGEEALKWLEAGTEFGEASKKFSQGTPLGVVERGQLRREIEQAVFSLQEGQISPLIEVSQGFYIFKALGKYPAQTAPLKEVKDSIYDLLYRKKFKDRLSKWLDKLKKNAYIEIKQ